MRAQTLLCLALFAPTLPAAAAETWLTTPTGARVACSEIASLRITDMPGLYDVENFYQEYRLYVRLRTTAPRDCARQRTLTARRAADRRSRQR